MTKNTTQEKITKLNASISECRLKIMMYEKSIELHQYHECSTYKKIKTEKDKIQAFKKEINFLKKLEQI